MVKPSAIYYNSSEFLKGLPVAGKDKPALSQKGRSKRDSSSSEERTAPSTPSAPLPAVRPKPTQRSFSVAGAPPDSASLGHVEPAIVSALEDRIKVRLLTLCALNLPDRCCILAYSRFLSQGSNQLRKHYHVFQTSASLRVMLSK